MASPVVDQEFVVHVFALECAGKLSCAEGCFALGVGLFERALDEIRGAACRTPLFRRKLAQA